MIDLNLVDKTHDEARQGEAVLLEKVENGDGRKLYIESYGCQMNFADSEIVASILSDTGYETTADFQQADVIFINTCSIRENAEQRVRMRLSQFKKEKQRNPKLIVGVLGCMAERLKAKFLEEEKLVDVVVGPDAYRDLPALISQVEDGHKAVNVILSREETYADINPVRLTGNGISAFISITRGCDNMCSFCVVPFTRGRERSRDPWTIVNEARQLFEQGYKEVTLLGQNVDSYFWTDKEASKVKIDDSQDEMNTLSGDALLEALVNKKDLPEKHVNKDTTLVDGAVNFAKLMAMVAEISPELRVRFSTSHPKDITDEVLYTMAKYDNICNYIHLPVQSGNSRILKLMNRTYDREWYMNRVDAIKRILPGCAISTDIITGFCTETEEEHQDTLTMMDYVGYSFAYQFAYSERPGTLAARKYEDDVPEEVKLRRLNEVIQKQQEGSYGYIKNFVGKTTKVLIEGFSKKSDKEYRGRNDENVMVVFPVVEHVKPGDYATILVERCTTATLIGKIV
ncbi:MAG: tRNA (N6-isopentenyl adenosine(37)-C2)-methylthiotransferase MiaB [Pedobacter sp.]|nr:MAG: tRNA (N6-isopentenyl adenosine(37)-C2)-methylthiotransferase MiaB [Pedobacter sp.]